MSTRNHRNTRRPATTTALAMEGLEGRICMAGDVAVTVEGTGLKIAGDALGNDVLVQQVAAQRIRVTGLDGTTINGAGSQEFAFGGGLLDINLKKGDDRLVLNDFEGRFLDVERLKIDLGKGSDVADIDDLIVRGTDLVTIELGKDDQNAEDVLRIDDTDIAGSLKVFMGGGDDEVRMEDSVFRRDLEIRLAGGADEVRLGEADDTLAVMGTLLIEGAKGADTVALQDVTTGEMNIALGSGTADLTANAVDVTGAFIFSGGSAFNDVELADVRADHLEINAPQGRTTADLVDVRARKLVITTGESVDRVGLVRVATDGLVANLGKGDDTLEADELAARKAEINGGQGNDTVTVSNFGHRFGFLVTLGDLTIKGNQGDDRVILDRGRAVNLTVDGNAGNDTLDERVFLALGVRDVKNVETVL